GPDVRGVRDPADSSLSVDAGQRHVRRRPRRGRPAEGDDLALGGDARALARAVAGRPPAPPRGAEGRDPGDGDSRTDRALPGLQLYQRRVPPALPLQEPLLPVDGGVESDLRAVHQATLRALSRALRDGGVAWALAGASNRPLARPDSGEAA